MKPLFLTLALLGMPLAAQPPSPSTDAPFTCLFEGVTAEQRAAAGAAASQRLTDMPPDGGQHGGATLEMISNRVSSCAETQPWSDSQQRHAAAYLLAQLARENMRQRYAAQGVDLGFLDEMAADPARRQNSANMDEAAARLRSQGLTGQRADSAEDVVFLYLSMALHVEAARDGFLAPPPR